jgi:predicted translin family RNA/ssDNA-binding protein
VRTQESNTMSSSRFSRAELSVPSSAEITDGRVVAWMSDLVATLKDAPDLFEVQRKNFGKGHGLRNDLTRLSKVGIAALKRSDAAKLEECLESFGKAMNELALLNLPEDHLWTFKAEAGQEVAEFYVVYAAYGYVMRGEDLRPIKTPKELGVTPQAYLSGLSDSVSELSKMRMSVFLGSGFSIDDRISSLTRLYEVSRAIQAILEEFETAYPQVADNSRRNGFFNTLRGSILKVGDTIERITDKLDNYYTQEAQNRDLLERFKRLMPDSGPPEESRAWELDEEGQEALVKAVAMPAEPTAQAREAARRGGELFGACAGPDASAPRGAEAISQGEIKYGC